MAEARPSTDDERAPLLNGDAERGDHTFPRSIKSMTSLERTLAVLAIALLCIASLGFGLFAGQLARNRTSPSDGTDGSLPVPSSPPRKNDEICMTPTCVQIAAGVLSSLDQTVDPCEDFYHFVNGGWLAANPVPEDKGLFGIAQMIDKRNMDILHGILDSEPSQDLAKVDKSNLKHLRSYYDSCLNEDALDKVGSEPLMKVVGDVIDLYRGIASIQEATQMEGPTLIPKKPSGEPIRRLTNAVLYVQSRGVEVFFGTDFLGAVREDPNLLRVWLNQPSLGLPDVEYYADAETLSTYQEVIRSTVAEIYSSRGEDGSSLRSSKPFEQLAYDIVTLEKGLASLFVKGSESDDPWKTYNPFSIKELQDRAPAFEWRELFSGFSPRPYFPDPIIVSTPAYFTNLTQLLRKTDEEVLEGYLVWRIAQEYGPLLGAKETARKETSHLEGYLSGVDEGVRTRREDSCLQVLLENAGFLVGRYYVQKAFTEEAKRYAEDIVHAVVMAFKDRLPELDWLDDKTRELAKEKASAIKIKIGYATSPNVTDPDDLARYYSLQEPFDATDYFGNGLRAKVAAVRRNWNKVGAKRDPGEWEMIPSEVNAYYTPEANDMTFPSGILQDCYFNKDWPEYMAFGAFGANAAGHEVTHAFDSVGRKYDKEGRLFDWWTNETARSFDELQECIAEQYAQYYVLDRKGQKVYVNSRMTLGEDVADAGGLAQSFRAWSDRFKNDPSGDRYDNYLLPGLNYTREQLYFISFARGWARNIKPAEAVLRIRTDPHSPTWARVIGTMSNSLEFSKAFHCKAGQPMSREQKCKVW